MSTSGPTHLGRIVYRAGDLMATQVSDAVSAGKKAKYGAIVASARELIAANRDVVDLPKATVDGMLITALANEGVQKKLGSESTLKLLEAALGRRFDTKLYKAKLEDIGAAFDQAIVQATRATRDEIRAIATGRRAGATDVAGLKRELKTIGKMALLGHWPDASETWLTRAVTASADVPMLTQYHELQRICWQVRLSDIPVRLMAMAKQGEWDAELEATYNDAAFHLSKGQYGLSNAKAERDKRAKGKQAVVKPHSPPPPRLARQTDFEPYVFPPGSVVQTTTQATQTVVATNDELGSREPPPSAYGAYDHAVDQIVSKYLAVIEADANKAMRADPNLRFNDAAAAALEQRFGLISKAVDKALPKGFKHKDTAIRDYVREQRASLLDSEQWLARMDDLVPDLRYGETFVKSTAPGDIVYAGADQLARAERQTLIESLVRVTPPADDTDALLLKQALNAFSIQMLRDLKNANYTISASRYLLTYGDAELRPIAGYADGVLRHNGSSRTIAVRTYWRDGALQLNISTLLHEVGHAYDLRIKGSDQTPFHLHDELVQAFKADFANLPTYYSDQLEFAAESLARYFSDPERCSGELWRTKGVYDKLGFAAIAPDIKSIAALQAAQVSRAVVNVRPDPFDFIAKRERVNSLRAKQPAPLEPYVIEIDGTSDQGVETLAASLAHTMRFARSPGLPPFVNGEELLKISADDFNDAKKLRALLNETVTARRGTMLFISDLSRIPTSSPGFKTLADHVERFGGIAPVILNGAAPDLDRLRHLLPTASSLRCTMDALTPQQITENVVRRARSEGFELSVEASAEFTKRAQSGGLSRAFDLWKQVKEAQVTRIDAHYDAAARTLQNGSNSSILSRDVVAAKLPEFVDPVTRMQKRTGLTAAKVKLSEILAHVKLTPDAKKRPRLNLLFSGNPGTGKTMVAEDFVAILYERKVIKRNKIAKPLVSSILDGDPAVNIKKLFEENKDGVIFFDEMHQLLETERGKQAFLALIPFLTNKEYDGTVFIGAGYDEELMALLRDVDKGGERRFEIVPFNDYSTEELGEIFDSMAKDFDVTPAVREAALKRVERERRAMMNFGNGGTVETVLKYGFNKCVARVAALDDPNAPLQMIPEDFDPPPVASRDEVWKQIDALKGLKSLKAQLRAIAQSIEVATMLGEDPLSGVPTNIVIRGPRGTGKTTVANILSRFFAAYDVVPTAKLHKVVGAVQGEFVGQTARQIRKVFENGWGGTIFWDEISGLAKAGGTFKDEAAKLMLDLLEDKRGRFIFVAADYPENIALFFGMDGGMESRFGLVLDTTLLGVDDAVDELVVRLGEKKRTVLPDVVAIAREALEELAEMPGYSSGREVRNLVDEILIAHNSALSDLMKAKNVPSDPRSIIPDAMRNACRKYVEKRRRSEESAAKLKGAANDNDAAYATETRALTETQETAKPSGSSTDAMLKKLARVNQEFAAAFANDPTAMLSARANPNSDYAKRLAEELGVSPAEAVNQISATEETLGVKVRSLQQRFEYHCPFCGQVESPNCAYIGMPMGWKVANSLKKPWVETVEEVIGAKS